jgi:hypothetical protein
MNKYYRGSCMKSHLFVLFFFLTCHSAYDAHDGRLDMKDPNNRHECQEMLEKFEILKGKALYLLDIAETGIVCMKNLLEQ